MIIRHTYTQSFLLLLAVAGCNEGIAPEDGIAGTYALHTWNGLTLPATVHQDDRRRSQVIEGSLELRTDLTFDLVERWFHLQDGVGSSSEQTMTGTWASRCSPQTHPCPGVGIVVTLYDPDGDEGSGAYRNERIELSWEGIDYVFVRDR